MSISPEQGENYCVGVIEKGNTELLAKPTEENLTGKRYDLNHDGVWNAFDLYLMKRAYLKNTEVDSVSSATSENP